MALRMVSSFRIQAVSATFLAFLFFAMPVFWFAVLLKEFGAIKLNNWLEHPGISVVAAVLVMAVCAGVASIIFNIGEKRSRQRGLIAAAGGAVFGLGLVSILATWFGGHTFTRNTAACNSSMRKFPPITA